MKFGVREICDVTFKAAANNQKVGNKVFKKYQPVFMIDTARTSSMEQASTTVYAQGGRGYARLIAWEGEKTMTFTVEDALISPMGLAVLSGAGLIKSSMDDSARVHITLTKAVETGNKITIDLADLQEETGLAAAKSFLVCNKIPMYATVVGSSGNVGDFLEIKALETAAKVTEENSCELEVDTTADVSGKTVIVDFYLAMTNSVTTVTIGPENFGGYFYVEAQTLFRDEATGKDLAAELIFPRVKIQSAFTFTMAASGDPSTFNFTMDAFPGTTMCDPTRKTMCDIQIIGTDTSAEDDNINCNCNPDQETPVFPDAWDMSGTDKATTIDPTNPHAAEFQANQDAVTISFVGNKVNITGDLDVMEAYESDDPEQGTHKWVALLVNTGEDSIIGSKYNGYAFTDDDVAEAAGLGGQPGEFVLWVKADEVVATPKTFTLSKDGKKDRTITVTFQDVE